MPHGAVDSHAHVIGPPTKYPFIDERSYTPPAASPEQHIEMLDGTGFTYGVLIQVSVHGTDNRLLLEALSAQPDRLRGIAVAPADLTGREYRAMKESGIVGLRLNDYFPGGIGFEEIERFDAIACDYGWHLELNLNPSRLSQMATRVSRLKANVVIDHMANTPTSEPVQGDEFQTLLALVRDGTWVKLSDGFRNSVAGPPYMDTVPFARALLNAAPDRCVWGSDWPHVAWWHPMMPVADLLDLLVYWAPDENLRNQVLVSNPSRLYGF